MIEPLLNLVRKADAAFRFRSIGWRIGVTLGVNVVLLFAVFAGVIVWTHRRSSLEQEVSAARVASESIVAGLMQLMEADEGERVRAVIKTLEKDNAVAEIRIIHSALLDEDEDVRKGPDTVPRNEMERLVVETGRPQYAVSKVKGRTEVFEYVLPIAARGACTECHDVSKGAVMGAAALSFSLDSMAAARRKFLLILAVATSLIAGLLVIVLGVVFHVTLSLPIKKMAGRLKHLSTGDVLLKPVEVSQRDEVSDLRRAYNDLLSTLRGLAQVADDLSKGDLKTTVQVRSEKDVLGNAFVAMLAGLNDLTEAAVRVASGDLTVKVRVRSERDTLGEAFSKMIGDLKVLIQHVGSSAENTGTAAMEIKVVAEKSLKAVGTHQARLEDISAATTELATGIQEVAGNSSHADARMKEIAELARRSKDVMTEGLHGLEATETAVREAVQDMTQLNQNCRRVGEIVKTIEGIAAQTNMLALNAAIEAARAGEAGSGFAVVADEVRKLAEKAASEAGNITSIIESIGEGANKTLAAVERTSKVTNETATLTVQAGKALDEILTSIAHTSKLSAEIRSATDQQAKAGDEVAGAVVQISQLSRESSAAFSQLAAESSKLLNGTEDLNSRIGQFKL